MPKQPCVVGKPTASILKPIQVRVSSMRQLCARVAACAPAQHKNANAHIAASGRAVPQQKARRPWDEAILLMVDFHIGQAFGPIPEQTRPTRNTCHVYPRDRDRADGLASSPTDSRRRKVK